MTEYFNDKIVCVTGGAGFVGSYLVERLIELGAEVVVLDNMSRGKNVIEGASYVPGDASLDSSCRYAFNHMRVRGEPVDIVFNLAASVAGVLHNMNHHHEMFHQNIGLQTMPVMAAEYVGVKTFVQVSSVCVYDPEYNHPSVEENGSLGEPHAANAGYAWAKRMGEQAIFWSNIKRGIVVRPSNIFGPRDYFDSKAHVIPAVIKRFVDLPVVNMYGPKDTVREFIYVTDVVEGMLAAAEHGADKGVYNLGVNDDDNTVTMEELADIIAGQLGDEDKAIVYHEDKGGGDPLRWSDSDLAHDELGWLAKVNLIEGIEETIQWYQNQI
jgi:nucleoside-diphosphate-sugar epimerase